jgi:hypothetical protein
MPEIPEECENTVEHALVHIKDLKENLEGADWDQALHNIALIKAFTENMQEINDA